jgi:hypothetical protein
MTDRQSQKDQKAGDSVKNPQQEAEHPAPMPRDQQGQAGGKSPRTDRAGQQGGTEGGGRG